MSNHTPINTWQPKDFVDYFRMLMSDASRTREHHQPIEVSSDGALAESAVIYLERHGPYDIPFALQVASTGIENGLWQSPSALASLVRFYDRALKDGNFNGGSEITARVMYIERIAGQDVRAFLHGADLSMPVQHAVRLR